MADTRRVGEADAMLKEVAETGVVASKVPVARKGQDAITGVYG